MKKERAMLKKIVCLTALCAALAGCVVAPAPGPYYYHPYYGGYWHR
jgi:ABC-type uncharacterized transport system auxiliary subunit